ncbi:MAG: hypothetical protein ABSG19_14240 [Candidatus Aminicenantales bacterium]
MREPNEKAWVVSVLMGLGHLRAAFPLKDIAHQDIVLYGSRRFTPAAEYRRWKRLRRIYYLFSRAGRVPVLGRYLLALMLALEKIPPLYPRRDRSTPNASVRYLDFLIRKRRLCRALLDRVQAPELPVVHTFYATAMALDKMAQATHEQYLLICDADVNRVWVPRDPAHSRLKYLAPCSQIKKRLMIYGVPEGQIYLTGFPLPKENLGNEGRLEILKEDLFQRLLRLDPMRKFFSYHQSSVLKWLDRQEIPAPQEGSFHLMFAIGGAGAQTEMTRAILKSLKAKILEGQVTVSFSCGIQKRVFEEVLNVINKLEMIGHLGQTLEVIFDQDVYGYFRKFNQALRRTDVLWTKPSELSFYCALGIPILIAPPIGTHEERNRRWLEEIHAGVEPAGRIEDCREWLFDLRDNGRLAEAAWDGFLKARKLGTYKIEKLVRTGSFSEGRGPLEQ